MLELLTPGLVLAADGKAFERAIEAVVPPGIEVVVTRNPPSKRAVTAFAQLLSAEPTAAVDAAHAKVGPDTVAKVLFTSGSTGMPKGVINTQRMWCCNAEMITNQLAYFRDEPPVILDWSPWHHTASGNHNVGFVLYNGGTYYIDEGKPAPGAIEATVKNLREVAPTWYFTVPKGFEALLPYFRTDAELRRTFFSRLKVLWFAGAALSQLVFDEMQQLAKAECGEGILFLTGLGATETAPMAIARMWQSKDFRQHGRAGAGRGAQAGAQRGQARGARERAQRHARLLAPARAHRQRLRRRGLLLPRRRGALRGSERPARGAAVRRPHRRGLQARYRHLGERRPAQGAPAWGTASPTPRTW